jgi:hypothetical protein
MNEGGVFYSLLPMITIYVFYNNGR